ncbi:MAG: PQQ-binding-like beta-propeller repeat protein, partial [Povalibacter sp.]
MPTCRFIALFTLLASQAFPVISAPPHSASADEPDPWSAYGGDPGGNRFSEATQINRANVDQLQIAWTYRTGELGAGFARLDKMSFEATPILASGSLFLSTPTNIVIALDPASGKERWRYDPHIPRELRYSEVTSRGVSYWAAAQSQAGQACAQRILIGTLDARLIALDAVTGTPCSDFGANGAVDLLQGVRATERGNYLITSPPAIFRDLVITGSAIGDNRGAELERGLVRAFDVRTGALRWSWDPIPDQANAPRLGWSPTAAQRTGAANAWSVLSVDAGRGLIFVPTGSASPDFFGGERVGDNRYADSLVALKADTGELVWHQQLVHHDLWDYDVAAQPMLIDIDREGKSIPAVVQATKTGMLFIFDRETGQPVFDVIERAVPQSDVPQEKTALTQPFPATPALVSHAAITPQDAWGLTFYDRGRCRSLIEQYRSEGIFTPPSVRGTIMSPGYAGGVNWGGLAFDVEHQLIVGAVNHIPTVVKLIPRKDFDRSVADSEKWPDSEFATQRGTAYGLRREVLMSPWGL